MNGKILFAALLMSLSSLMPAEAASVVRTLPDGSEPPYKYMQKGIKTRPEDLKISRSSRPSRPSANTSVGEQAQKPSSADNPVSGNRVRNVSGGDCFVAVKTNIACYAGAVANIGAEVQLHPHVTLDMPVSMSFWDMERAHGLRLVLFQPEARYWFGHAGSGHFIGLHAHVAGFNIQWNDWRYQSAGRPLLGGGISYGYSLRISDHWNFEFNLGAGYANMKYDRFYNIDNGAQSGGGEYDYWGITRLGLSLVYKF